MFDESAELIYHEYCLAEAAGLEPDPAEYLARFPDHANSLSRLFMLHGAFSASTLRGWVAPAELPSSGDSIGPYHLLRELGRGAFARVFLAEQTDLDDRLVVLKVSTRATAEPRLLARASHAHIVEVLWHDMADDGALHLVCMPFLGGATLAAVLEGRRKRKRRPRSGLDLLADLDRVSAPEYPPTELARPAREILSRLSYRQALAWVLARLAEALDHAHQRGVAHGDLKPSNILLTAEANPLLLDFNLSVDWRDANPGDHDELGGTLAYMAPERLDAIAQGGGDSPRKASALHRADLYAIGLLLLEALTGKAPEIPRRQAGTARELAGELAGLRRTLPAALGSGGDHSIPPALRSILAKCLAPDPLDRYARGNELAEDLDRWRSDRPLVFADEPRRSELSRKVRLRRAPLVAFALSMVVAVVATVVASFVLKGTRRDQALAKYSTITDRIDSNNFAIRKDGLWRPDILGDPIELASRKLSRYNVLADPLWRSRDDIQSLPERERGELEVWLFEQILRYATALGDAPESPESWKRGLALLDRTLRQVDSESLQAQRRVLLKQLDRPDQWTFDSRVPRLPSWMDDYLAGIAAEPLHAREAMGHFLDALKKRPGLFWAHYRTAVAACRINEYDEAVKHLRRCVERSPDNPALHVQLAEALYKVSRDLFDWHQHDLLGDALRECHQAIDLDPDYAIAYEIRANLLQNMDRNREIEEDLGRYTILTRHASAAPSLDLRLQVDSDHHFLNKMPGQNEVLRLTASGWKLARRILEIDPKNHRARIEVANDLAWNDLVTESLAELERVLKDDPDHLEARYRMAVLLAYWNKPAAIKEFNLLINHPCFEELFSDLVPALKAYHVVATDLMQRGKFVEALDVGERALLHVKRSRALQKETILSRNRQLKLVSFSPEGETIYLLARIHMFASNHNGFDPNQRREHFAKSIQFLSQICPGYPNILIRKLNEDPLFKDSRDEICRRLRIDSNSPPLRTGRQDNDRFSGGLDAPAGWAMPIR